MHIFINISNFGKDHSSLEQGRWLSALMTALESQWPHKFTTA